MAIRVYVLYWALVAGSGLSCVVRADDWPQWLGPQRDSVWREKGIVREFPAAGLKIKWRAPVASGYAGPAVAAGRVYVTDYLVESGERVNNPGQKIKLEGEERVLCLDAKDGSLMWKQSFRRSYNVSYPGGPRVMPTVVDGKVYALGCMGDLCCLDASSGKLLWSKDLKKEYRAEVPLWGFSGHPLVDGEKLICIVGGQGSVAVALNKDTGAELWKSLSASEPGYCSPAVVDVGGDRQVLIWHPESINGLAAETGKALWSVPLKPNYAMSIATPRVSGEYAFVSGVGNAGVVLKLDRTRPAPEIMWRGDSRNGVYCSCSTPFVEKDVIFGVCQKGELRAVDLRTGQRLWETNSPTTGPQRQTYGTAFLVKHDDRYFLFNETGDLVLARLSRERYQEISRFHVLEPTNEAFGRPVVWSHPAFANQCVYARNDKEIVCVSLAE